MTRGSRTFVAILVLAAVYFCAGKFGLSLAYIHVSASAVWPPSGIALAALILWGYRLWPGIFLGAFLVNITTQGSVPTTLGIAAGNTLEALLGAWFVCRFANGVAVFERAKNIFKFVLLAAILSTAVSASFGVTSLAVGGFARWDDYPAIWLTWWLGDMVGDLIIAPLLVIWLIQPPLPLTPRKIFEAAGLLLALAVVAVWILLEEIPFAASNQLKYLCILPLLWAGFRFGQRGAVTSVFIISSIALWGTLNGLGPFVTPDPNKSLLLLQAFVGTVTVIALMVAAVVAEHDHAEEALREAKDQLARTNKELEQRIEERTADLEQAKASLLKDIEEQKKLEEQLRQSQKLESIGTLAAGIAHDFNNVLNIIKGYASLLGHDRSVDQTVTESLAAIDDAIARGASTVRQLLTLARKSEAELTSTSINDVITELAKLLRQTFPKTVEVSLDLAPQLPPVKADPNQIRQALLNLCVNARDAMPNGGRLALKTTATEATITQDNRDGFKTEPYVCIEVSDTGKGMDESVRSRIFEPFFTTKQTGEGTGLGLAIVYGIVQNHRGFVDVESQPGDGTTFRLCLPVVLMEQHLKVDEVLGRGPAPVQRSGGVRGTVLVVEDEEAMVRLLRDVLCRRGYQVLVALDGEEAIDLYHRRQREIDVVLLDIGLPKIGGRDVMRRMKEENPRVKIIVASGHIEPELRSEMHRAGVKDFFYKPYTVEQIVERLDTLIES